MTSQHRHLAVAVLELLEVRTVSFLLWMHSFTFRLQLNSPSHCIMPPSHRCNSCSWTFGPNQLGNLYIPTSRLTITRSQHPPQTSTPMAFVKSAQVVEMRITISKVRGISIIATYVHARITCVWLISDCSYVSSVALGFRHPTLCIVDNRWQHSQ